MMRASWVIPSATGQRGFWWRSGSAPMSAEAAYVALCFGATLPHSEAWDAVCRRSSEVERNERLKRLAVAS